MLSFLRKNKGPVAFLVFLIIFVLAGCSKPQKKPAQSPAKPKIGISMASMEGDGYATFKKAVDKGKDKEKVDVVWKDAKHDPMEQAVNVDDLIKAKVKVLIMHPVDTEQSQGLVKKATEAKVKVLALEQMPLNVNLDGLITPDFTRAGEFQGELLAEKVSIGRVLVFTVSEDDPMASQLWLGLRKALDKSTGLEILRYTISPLAKVETAKEDVLDALVEHPEAKAVVAQSSILTEALMDVLKELPTSSKMVTIGIGASKKAIVAMAEGKHTGEVDTRPDILGDQAIRAAAQLAKGETLEYDNLVKNDNSDIPARIIPGRMITRENLYLLEDRWGKEIKKAQKEAKKAQEEEKGSSGGEAGEKKSGDKKNKVKITTKEGKTLEVEIEGEIKKIESEAPKGGEQGGGGSEGSGGGGQ